LRKPRQEAKRLQELVKAGDNPDFKSSPHTPKTTRKTADKASGVASNGMKDTLKLHDRFFADNHDSNQKLSPVESRNLLREVRRIAPAPKCQSPSTSICRALHRPIDCDLIT
jgi:hypothetical protein